ncbi:hypothetical protein NHX12_021668 [Muraenolepis orangiensis]|uniref:PX domain-containing protein n=1 Tax=Muraenolepis orangiensis TaxID=630683 RepID=A0A9Q0IVS3_9TELE|nr:hypothetical protein NHX12_021668 [Muraenolepis orangiensis]
MAAPFVPVPVPMDRGLCGGASKPRRPPRASSLGSVSGSGDRGRTGSKDRGNRSRTPPPLQSPLARINGGGPEAAVEYSSCPRSASDPADARPATPTLMGYEVMEERAKFTVYKVLVKKSQEESWVVFRRYTDFSRLNDKLVCSFNARLPGSNPPRRKHVHPFTQHLHPAPSPSTFTQHLHPAPSPSPFTQHLHPAPSPSTFTQPLHPAPSPSTFTQHLHPAPSPSTFTQHLHPAPSPSPFTQHLHPAPSPSTFTQHLHPAPSPSTFTQHATIVMRRITSLGCLFLQLKEMFPGFRLSLPPKRWFKDNYDTDFLEERQLGLQAFLQNLVAHKDIAHSLAVREFLCFDDPPGPFDSLEESRAFCETLEESNFRLLKEVQEKQKEIQSLRMRLQEQEVLLQERRVPSWQRETRGSVFCGAGEHRRGVLLHRG